MKENKWVRLLAYITGLVNQELLLQNEYLGAPGILRAHLPSRLRLSDPQRSTLAEIGKRLGRKALAEVARVAKPDTILEWYRKLIAQKFDGSKHRSYPGRPPIEPKLAALIVQNGQGEFRLGLRSDRRCARQSGLCGFGPDGGQRLEAARHCTGAKTKPEHDLEGIHSIAYGGIGRHGFLHGGSAELARLGNVLRVVLHSPGESSRQPGRDHTTS